MKVAVISGASGGIGRAAADLFNKKGWQVYDLSRSGEDTENRIHIETDVTVEASVQKAFERIAAREGQIDLLILSAGCGISGAAEFTALEKAKKQLDVNFFGTFLCVKYAMPLLRQGKGRILAISSAAAVFPIPFQSFYSASKAAINSFILALRNEVKDFSVDAAVIMPGDVQTGFTAARDKNHAGEDVYGGKIDASVSIMEKDETGGMTPDVVAKCIWRVAKKKHTRPLYTAGIKYKIFVGLSKILGMTLVNRVLGIMYIKNPK